MQQRLRLGLLLLLGALCVTQTWARTLSGTTSSTEHSPVTESFNTLDDEDPVTENQEDYVSELEKLNGSPLDKPPTEARWDDRVSVSLSGSGHDFTDFSAPAYKIIEFHDDEQNDGSGPGFDPFSIVKENNDEGLSGQENIVGGSILSPKLSLQQQIFDTEFDPMKNSVVPEASEEYFWDSEGDADYLRFDETEKFLHPSLEIISDSIAPRLHLRKAGLPPAPSPLHQPPAEPGPLNVVITKGPSSLLDKTEKLKLLKSSQVLAEQLGSRVTSSSELDELLRSAVDAAFAHSEPEMRDELQKVLEPGYDAADSKSANVSAEIQLALDAILNSHVVYRKENLPNSSSVSLGYVPAYEGSRIDLVNNRLPIKKQGPHAYPQTSQVNIFLVNIIRNNHSFSQNKILDSELDKDTLGKIFTYENLFGDGNPNTSHGLTLNHNTILNLLPDFVKATTVSPVVPLSNASLHESLEVKPSVLGLLPNDIFTLKKGLHTVSDDIVGNWKAASEKQILDFIDNKSNEDRMRIYPSLHGSSERPLKFVNGESSYQLFSNDHSLLEQSHSPERGGSSFSPNKIQPALGSARRPIIRDDETTVNQSLEDYSSSEIPSSSVNRAQDVDSDKSVKPISPLELEKTNNNTSSSSAHKTSIEKKKESSYLNNVQSVVKALAIGALPSGVAVASAFWPVWAPALFGRRRRKRSASSETNADWFSILNGSRYNSRSRLDDFMSGRMSNSSEGNPKKSIMKTSDLAALIQSAAPSTMKIAENSYTSVNPALFLEKHTTKPSYSESQNPKIRTSGNKRYKLSTVSSKVKTKDNMKFSIDNVHSMLTESSTRESVFMTTPHFGDGKSPTEDVQLVSNFLTSALNGWSSESNTTNETPKNSYIQINVSNSDLNDTVSNASGSPIVLVDKETGKIKPISNVSKNDTDLANKIGGDLNERLSLLRNRSETTTSSTTITKTTTTPSTTVKPTTTPRLPVTRVATTTRRRVTRPTTTSTTTTTTTPAPSGPSSMFTMLASAIQNPPPEVASAMSFVGTITVYSAAALMPLWLPLVVGKRRKKRSASAGSELDYSETERLMNDGFIELLKKVERKFS